MNRILWFFIFTLITLTQAFTTVELRELRNQFDNGIIPIEPQQFHQFFNGPKDHFLILLFTTSNEKFQCHLCQLFQPAFQTVALSLLMDYPDKLIFWATVEFEPNMEHYERIQLNTVPHVWVYPPTEDPLNDVTSNHYLYQVPDSLINQRDDLQLNFAEFLSSVLHLNIIVHKGFDTQLFIKNFAIYLLIFLFIKRRGNKILHRLSRWQFYYLICIIFIAISVSGYQFCIQRQVPFIARDSEGGVMMFSGGAQYQFGLEMVNVVSIYTVLSGTMIMLIEFNTRVTLPLQTLMNLACLLLMFTLYNLLCSVLLVKDPSYPLVPWKLY